RPAEPAAPPSRPAQPGGQNDGADRQRGRPRGPEERQRVRGVHGVPKPDAPARAKVFSLVGASGLVLLGRHSPASTSIAISIPTRNGRQTSWIKPARLPARSSTRAKSRPLNNSATRSSPRTAA